MKKLFGTDGIRGEAGTFPLDGNTISAVGMALAQFLMESSNSGKILLGRDTRQSGLWISQTLAHALSSRHTLEIHDAGVITTPGLAYLTREHRYAIGIMISASHNPFQDNGIKVFSGDGFKLPDSIEIRIEKIIESFLEKGLPSIPPIEAQDARALVEDYLSFLEGHCHCRLTGFRIGIDVCNGAAFQLAPRLFRQLGAKPLILNDQPNGRNINLNCGSLHMEDLSKFVVTHGLDFGIAFDGDADRVLFVTGSGKLFDGDFVLFSLARRWRAQGALKSNKIIGTLMTNFALEQALQQEGFELIRAGVGDKYVLEEMERFGSNLGGEPSGHIILKDLHTTGDGLLTALKVAELVAMEKKSLDELGSDFHPCHQILEGLHVHRKIPIESSQELKALVAEGVQYLQGRGRLVIRYSGTEPLLRIMAEGDDYNQIRSLVDHLTRKFSELLI
jgi:phosphoglucosamine mutase